jgi:hypothetical protein
VIFRSKLDFARVLVLALTMTSLSLFSLDSSNASSPQFQTYLDAPFVQGSYVRGSANSLTETFDGFSPAPSGTSCSNATWAVGTVSSSSCSMFPNNNDFGAITASSKIHRILVGSGQPW